MNTKLVSHEIRINTQSKTEMHHLKEEKKTKSKLKEAICRKRYYKLQYVE